VSGRTTTWVANCRISPEKGDPRAQLRRATESLPADTHVRVLVEMPPIRLGISMSFAPDFSWFRDDLNWQFEADADHAEWAMLWSELTEQLRRVK